MTVPISPYGVGGRCTLEQLVAERARHTDALTRHQYIEALPAAEVAEHTLAVLAVSERLALEARASRWVYATEALAAGATPDQVATAMGLRYENVLRTGLRDWTEQQVEHGLMSPPRRDEVLALVADAALPPGVTPGVVSEMRAWLCDCAWADVDTTDIALMPDVQIVAAVERHWDGGLANFLHDALTQSPERGAGR
jgi:hypothetical protein